MRKNGNVAEATGIIVFLFIFAMSALLFTLLMSVLNQSFADDPSIDQRYKDMFSNVESQFPGVLDFWFVLFFIGLPLVSAALAYFNYIHPVFFWVSLLLVVIVVIQGASLAELWSALGEDAVLAEQQVRLPMMNYILNNYGLYSFFIFIIIAGGTFVKLRGRSDAVGGFT